MRDGDTATVVTTHIDLTQSTLPTEMVNLSGQLQVAAVENSMKALLQRRVEAAGQRPGRLKQVPRPKR